MKKTSLFLIGPLGMILLLLLMPGAGPRAGESPAPGAALPLPAAGANRVTYSAGLDSGWVIETVDTTDDVGSHTAIALDSSGQPWISYYDVTQGDLKCASFDGTSWQSVVIDAAGDVGWYTSLALDAADQPHISYYDYGEGDLKYAYYVGTAGNCGPGGDTWYCETVETAGYAGLYTSIVLDSAGWPHISYIRDTVTPYPDPTPVGALPLPGGQGSAPDSPRQLRYAWQDGAGWHFQTVVMDTGAEGGHTSLALDSAGLPHISYFDSILGALRHTWYDGTQWHLQTVDPDAAGQYTSLAVDSADHLHISYYAYLASDLRYAYYDGSAWQLTAVDTAGDVGRYTSLALDPAGWPRISYMDYSNSSLKYASYDGATWDVETVDNTAAVGGYSSLALDARAWPHISFYDYTNGDLKYAHWRCYGVTQVNASGPLFLEVGASGLYTATYVPVTATVPVTLAWDNGTIGANAVYSWTLPGDYTITVTATNPCGQVQDSLLVHVCQPVEGVTIEGPADLRTGETGVYTATYTPSNADPVLLTWDNGTVGPTASYSWTLPGDYTITVTATNPCGQAQDSLLVHVCQPVEEVTIEGPADLRTGETGVYTATYTPSNADPPVLLTWDNGTTGPTAAYSWTQPGVYTIVVTASNGCSDVQGTLVVTVCQPVEEVTIEGPADLRTGETGVYTATYTPSNADPPVLLTWDNGTVGPTASYSWTLLGDYTITVTATNPCGQAQDSLLVHVCQPVEGVTIEGPADLRTGETGVYTATYTPSNADPPVLLTWDNGTVGPTASYSWTQPGVYTIVVTTSNGCSDVQGTLVVTVCQPVEGVTIGGPVELVTGQVAQYTAVYTPSNASPPVDLTWDNGTMGPTAAYSWTLPGDYMVMATATNPCGEAEVTFTVHVCQPVAGLTVTGPISLTPGQVGVYAAVYTPANADQPVAVVWDNGTTGLSASYSWSRRGQYTIVVTASNACGQVQATFPVSVRPTVWYLFLPVTVRNWQGPGNLGGIPGALATGRPALRPR
jgi:hypothetical protein